jgi:hypothetical protein
LPSLPLYLDFSVQPYSIGDTLLALAAGHAVADERGLDGFDLIAVADPRAKHADPNMAARHATPWASLGALLPLLDLACGLKALDVHAAPVPSPAGCWPPTPRYATYDAIQAIAAYHRRHGRCPRLNFSPALCSWADRFLEGRITVNLRASPAHHAHRNHAPEVWAKAMECAARELGASFLVVGEAHEVDPILRERPYVHFAKDYGTTLLQDLALVHRSKAHMGSCSGPMAVAMLGAAPCFFVGADMGPHLKRYGGALREDGGNLVFSFAAPRQRFSPQRESVGLLVDAIRGLVTPLS